ncbi:MAG: 3-methyl-2-oxobutanoate hydroxymethyltransferase [Clostridia bacterium]|nr:3-methyl-2-oxobutanoate hydroxymethyltransferase [Clostridia bacterium]MDQ7791911.1 3-methyl-2-oxobutanoate hydroxymethyltransferase [Clostridia bacterium]
MAAERVNTAYLARMKREGRRITMLTAYDYPTAGMLDRAGIDVILVGDSVGNVVLGYESTIPVTLDDMVHHARAVSRAAQRAMVVADLPFMTYHLSTRDALASAGRLMQQGRAQAVKLEGGREVTEQIRMMVRSGIPVMAHIGLTPQSVYQLGGYRVQGKEAEAAFKLLDDAHAVQEAGAFAMVLECVPAPLARMITEELHIPTIGIGAGPHCDGQVLVTHDMLSLGIGEFTPRFVKKYADLGAEVAQALASFREEVAGGQFPAPEHGFAMPEEELEKLKKGRN